MEPRIQYATTGDGVNIAYATAGDGPAVIRVPPVPWSHVQREWDAFSNFLVTKRLAAACRTIWYDSRGSGLSDRDNLDFSVDALLRDLEAVAEKAGGETHALVGIWDGVPPAIAYAAAYPERVTHLVLVEGYTRGSDYLESPAGKMELGIRDQDWVLYTDMLARLIWGFEDAKLGQRVAEHLRACAAPAALQAAYDTINREWDISELASQVLVPTLVVNNETLSWLPVRAGQRLAAAIPNAQFSVVDDLAYEHVPELIAAFLGVSVQRVAQASGTAIILFVDVVDSTPLTERLGDAAFREKARALNASLRNIIRESGGTSVEGPTLGDGVLAIFTSARQAIEGALACARAGDEGGLPLHLGIHAGDVIRETDPDGRSNVYGGAVNIASRIAGESAPGEVLVSETVRGLARTSAGAVFEDRGEHSLKGIDDPQRLFAVRALD